MILKRLIGRLFFWMRTNANDSLVQALQKRNKELEEANARYRDLEIPSLKRQVDLEQAEVEMLKEKLVAWRTEVKEDIRAREARVGENAER